MSRPDCWLCPGCAAAFTSHELGKPEHEQRHALRCTVRWQQSACAWSWPYPFSLRGAFVPGFNAFDLRARDKTELPYRALDFGVMHRSWCEARGRYLSGVRR